MHGYTSVHGIVDTKSWKSHSQISACIVLFRLWRQRGVRQAPSGSVRFAINICRPKATWRYTYRTCTPSVNDRLFRVACARESTSTRAIWPRTLKWSTPLKTTDILQFTHVLEMFLNQNCAVDFMCMYMISKGQFVQYNLFTGGHSATICMWNTLK